jgi:tyrosine-specific transport protein
MAATGWLLLEVCCWVEKDSNIVTMATRTLGKPGRWAAWLLYLFLFYCLNVAYIVGCASLVVEIFNEQISSWLGALIIVMLTAPLVYAGARFVGRINVPLMVGLAVSYCAFVVLGAPHVNFDLLRYRDWSFAPMALPIAFTAFAYQGIVPTLYSYMHHDIKRTRNVILIGSFVPLIIYTIWQALILGIIPPFGPGGLVEAMKNGENAVEPMKNLLQTPEVYIIGISFAFFALITSFIGVSLALVDFLSDGLKVEKTPKGKLLLCSLVFMPPMLIAFTYPYIFLIALDLAGGFGCALLLGLLPILMVWSGRYYLKLPETCPLPGGRAVLVALILFVVFQLLSQFIVLAGLHSSG